MKFQALPYSCGAAAVVNALRCLGKKVSETRVRALAGTTEADGTPPSGIREAIVALGYEAADFEFTSRRQAVKKLEKALAEGNPVIICTQNWQHWITVVAGLDGFRRFLVADPANTVKNLAENGTSTLSRRELLKTWQYRKVEFGFYGVICRRRK